MSQTLSLFRLQKIDSQIDRLQTRLTSIRSKLENDELIRQANGRVSASDEARRTAEHLLQQIEITVQDQRIKIDQTEASLYEGMVKNPKELQDLQNDVSALKRHFATLEERQLEAMEALEEAEKVCRDAKLASEATQTSWENSSQNLIQEEKTLMKEFEKLSIERGAAVEPISSESLLLYDRLRQKKGGIAVTSLTDRACDACGAPLTPAQRQQARSNKLIHCPSCERFLYVD